ncbi:MarR family winged helix-turn-helix transcriptional regulator [Paractinoplanes hotanensis]|uniref:MarR family winged helix-turn-helix transcriptional regulator n=1 Tax=Paractinoplanes hotanensis TaxID=2906497 RepID=A0ABT0XWU8_9ACTN|nr:MarR family winged helix-turn-helix transcriptional regulator [Actinoplanes hotanensis]MCM4078261.1 MarR family winged helix-turn-helix transcriptional regulator [Actinoplanes hotanensis]
MELQSLTPATQAVLKALAELGQGNVHELAEKSGKARSTTDKAIRTLSEAGLIVEVDLGTDPAEGTPTRWTLSEDTAAALDAADLSDDATAGSDETDNDPDSGSTNEPDARHNEPFSDGDGQSEGTGDHDSEVTDSSDEDAADGEDDTDDDADDTGAPAEAGSRPTVIAAPRPGDRKVMAIKGVLADHGEDGATVDMIVAESGISHPTTIRLLAAMEQADAARRLPGLQQRWISGPTKASEVDPNPEPPRCALCFQVIRGVTSTPAAVAAVQSLIRPDGTLHIVGPDDETHVVTLPTRLPPRQLNNSASSVGRRSDVTVNADGSQPFARGELERLTIDVLAANPGRAMTPQEIATAISAKLDGRTVSSGAVRNNCTKAAATGSSIQLVSDAPLTFVFPVPEADSNGEQAPDGEQPDADTPDGDDNASARPDQEQDNGEAHQS